VAYTLSEDVRSYEVLSFLTARLVASEEAEVLKPVGLVRLAEQSAPQSRKLLDADVSKL
jgi:hypothetical protein